MTTRGNRQDIIGGLLFFGFGVAGVLYSLRYELGTAQEMGPGYMPVGVFGIMTAIGVAIAANGVISQREKADPFQLRPALMVLLATSAFAVLIRTGGFFIATLALVVVASLAEQDNKLRQSIVSGLLLAFFGTLIFSVGLGIPLPAWPWSQ